MDLLAYLNKKVYIKLSNGFYYSGFVVDAQLDDISIIDKTGKRVSLAKSFIISIEEIKW